MLVQLFPNPTWSMFEWLYRILGDGRDLFLQLIETLFGRMEVEVQNLFCKLGFNSICNFSGYITDPEVYNEYISFKIPCVILSGGKTHR